MNGRTPHSAEGGATALLHGHEPTRMLAGTVVALVAGLAGWTAFLAEALPAVHTARHWNAPRIGFDAVTSEVATRI